jgi:ABC-type multidrug transport system fused ATPase/permease subunit
MDRARREVTFWSEVCRAAPGAAACALVLVALAAGASYGVMVGAARLVESLVQGGGSTWTWFAVTVGCLVAQPVAGILVEAAGAVSQAGVTLRCQDLIARAALAPHGIGHLETPDSASRLRGAAEHTRDSMQLDAVPQLWRWLGIRVRGVAALVVVGHWSWLAAAVVAAAQLANSRAMTRYLELVQADLVDQASAEGRRATYLWRLLLERRAGKEVRLFGLTHWALGRYAGVWEQAQDVVQARRGAGVRPVYASSLVLTAATLAVLVWLALDARGGGLSVATMVAAAQGVAALSAFGNLGDTSVQLVRARSSVLTAHGLGGALPVPPPVVPPPAGSSASPVSFEDVTFGYPSSADPVLRHLNLQIAAGQSVAVVGVNGVGKSTLIKLLCGLYRPDEGRVWVGGMEPATDDVTRRRVAVIFQDFTRYQLSLRDNVGLPLVAQGHSTDDVATATDRALHDAAGDDVLDRVGRDWSTVLDPCYPGGAELSGGQWQRVALARALAAVDAGAGVLVLDEPTAALDVRAEAQIFDRFLEVTRGVTSILVSHRLSSVRHAERIVVLGPDGILQDGSHAELLAAGGPYAEMFRLQAARFAGTAGDALTAGENLTPLADGGEKVARA